ncbi:insulinase family protein [Nocardioides sp. C4-1]|uniref:insulinase family protein n=1 Tax=Nocardioides sp. C4-1 TaxID=3151851 RepID=UPI00326357AA
MSRADWADRLRHEERVLSSGTRLLLLDRPGVRSAVVLSHVHGGSRLDPPGAAGTAHLTEHLLTQGLAPDGERWVTPVVLAGGDVSATTHPDYLEFCFEGPHEALPAGIAAERARLSGWPVLRDTELDKQRDGVWREIQQHVGDRATRSLPWPDLGLRVFGSWSEGHDPFGDVDEVARLTEADCRAFWSAHHRPVDTVVVVVADLRRVPGGADALADALDGPVPGSATTRQSVVPMPQADSDGVLTAAEWSAPHSVGALAWRVPSVVDAPQAYAGLLVVAAHLGRHPAARGRLGQMTPMDRLDGDALTLTVVDDVDAAPGLDLALREVAAVARRGADMGSALRRARADVAAALDRPRGAAELLARGALLGGSPDAAVRWVEAVREVTVDDVVHAARLLDDATPVGLVGRPPVAARSTRPPSGSPVRLVAVDRASLSSSASVRLAAAPGPATEQRLRAAGCTITRDLAGWVAATTAAVPADELMADLAVAVGDLAVRHVALTGRRASRAVAWVAPTPAPTVVPSRSGLEVRPLDGWPPDVAGAKLRWPTDGDGFVARWLGIALVADLQARSHGRDPAPFAAPPDTVLTLRQEAVPGDQALVVEVWASPEGLPAALEHVRRELSEVRLVERAAGVPDTAVALAGQWLRDESDGATWCRRATTLLDLGASDDDVRHFDERLLATPPRAVVDRLLADTASEPHGWVRTAAPELVTGVIGSGANGPYAGHARAATLEA